MLAVQIGRAHFGQLHAQFARDEARQRNFELRIGKEEDALAREGFAMRRRRHGCAHAAGIGGGTKRRVADPECICSRLEPGCGSFGTEREGRGDVGGSAFFEGARRLGEEGLGQQETGSRPDGRHAGTPPGRKEGHVVQPQIAEDPA